MGILYCLSETISISFQIFNQSQCSSLLSYVSKQSLHPVCGFPSIRHTHIQTRVCVFSLELAGNSLCFPPLTLGLIFCGSLVDQLEIMLLVVAMAWWGIVDIIMPRVVLLSLFQDNSCCRGSNTIISVLIALVIFISSWFSW